MRGPDEPRELRPIPMERLHDPIRVPRPDRQQRADWRRQERRGNGKVLRR